jgi:hypothetical protein
METSLESHGFIALLTSPWFLAVVGGTIILGIAIAYGMTRASRRTPRERTRTEEGTRDIYHKDEQSGRP